MELITILKSTYDRLSKIKDIEVEELFITPPINKDDLNEIERCLGFTFPECLREFYLQNAGSTSFNWTARTESYGEECKIGGINILSPSMILHHYLEMNQMVEEANLSKEELEKNPGIQAMVRDWPHWIPAISFMNGDFFCMDKKDSMSPIVFLEHDVMDGGPYIHGLVIASNYGELFVAWSQIGFAEINDWSQYIGNKGLDVNDDVFLRMREAILKA